MNVVNETFVIYANVIRSLHEKGEEGKKNLFKSNLFKKVRSLFRQFDKASSFSISNLYNWS